jgi:hypothetical protein
MTIPLYDSEISLNKEIEYIKLLSSKFYSGTVEIGAGPGYYCDYDGKRYDGSPVLASKMVNDVIAVEEDKTNCYLLSKLNIPNITVINAKFPLQPKVIPKYYFVNVDIFALSNIVGNKQQCNPDNLWNLIDKIDDGAITLMKPYRGQDRHSYIFPATFGKNVNYYIFAKQVIKLCKNKFPDKFFKVGYENFKYFRLQISQSFNDRK